MKNAEKKMKEWLNDRYIADFEISGIATFGDLKPEIRCKIINGEVEAECSARSKGKSGVYVKFLVKDEYSATIPIPGIEGEFTLTPMHSGGITFWQDGAYTTEGTIGAFFHKLHSGQ